ncbi:MAG TPA: chemotaxis protein CheD, partial [Pyrinomonadaceae bacterium]|nr:chemotaxis protein CheD [Pyrinomonadaceae bacterium]
STTVGIADMKISRQPDDVLITYALGSCLGIAVYDAVAKVGGLLHVMLPVSTVNPAKAADNPLMFVDTGVPELFKACYKAGAKKERMVVKVAGGASLQNNGDSDQFQIGKRNFLMLRKLLWKNNVLIESFDVGENFSRTMSLELATGDVVLKINNKETRL